MQEAGIEGRLRQHLSYARKVTHTRIPFYHWLRKHADEAQVFLIEEGDDIEREQELIEEYRAAGHRLLNVQRGGRQPGIPKTSAESRALRSEMMRGNQRAKGVKRSDEYREKKRQERLGVTCQEGCKCGRHRTFTEERKARIAAALKGKQTGGHTRWHVNRGIVKPGCTWCDSMIKATQ